MAVPVQCTECGYQFRVPDEYAGKRGRCPKCRAMLSVPPSVGREHALGMEEGSPDGFVSGGGNAGPKSPSVPYPPGGPPPLTVVPPPSQAGSLGLPRIATDDASAPARGPSVGRASLARRRSGVPAWLWACLAVSAVLLAGVAVWAMRSGERQEPSRASSVIPQRSLPSVDRPPPRHAESHGDARAELVRSSVPPPSSEESGLAEMPREITASTLDEVKRAVVKVEVPVAGGTRMESGSGFFVDGRGWIATNDHVIRNITSSARVRLADGMICQIEGIVARMPDRDLALLKLRERPYQMTLLDIHRSDPAKLGEQVYAFGHPYDADFSLSKGIVSRVLSTGELNEGAKQMLQSTIQTPDNVIWIQHDAKISPGNSGGPLIDEKGRVLGVNSFVHVKAEFGYASDVRYLRELVQAAEDKATPLPPAGNVVQQQTPGAVDQSKWNPKELPGLFARAERFHFQPDSEEEYTALTELAFGLTMSKHVEQQPGGVPKDAAAAAGRLADELVAKLEAIEFGAEQFTAVNRFARTVEETPGQGLFAFVIVVGHGSNALILQVANSDKRMLVHVGPELANADPLSRWLVLGVYSNQIVQVRQSEEGEPEAMRVLMMYYMLGT